MLHTKNTGAGRKAAFRWNFEMTRAGNTGGCASAYIEREFCEKAGVGLAATGYLVLLSASGLKISKLLSV